MQYLLLVGVAKLIYFAMEVGKPRALVRIDEIFTDARWRFAGESMAFLDNLLGGTRRTVRSMNASMAGGK